MHNIKYIIYDKKLEGFNTKIFFKNFAYFCFYLHFLLLDVRILTNISRDYIECCKKRHFFSWCLSLQ